MWQSRHSTSNMGDGCKMSGKLVFSALAIVLVFAVGTTAALAYLVSSTSADNHFKMAHNTIEVVEEFDPPAEIEEDSTITKKVQVRNTGTSDCYVRVFAEFADSDAAAFVTIMYAGGEGFNEEDWSCGEGDGYWYYNQVLLPGDITSPLFDAVAIGDDPSLLESFDILVYAESVQSGGYEDQAAAWAAFSQRA